MNIKGIASPARSSMYAALLGALGLYAGCLHESDELATGNDVDTAQAISSPDAQAFAAWHKAVISTPPPRHGCFHASYPSTALQEHPCVTAPTGLVMPARSVTRAPSPDVVGGGFDYAAQVSNNSLSGAEGHFASVTGLTSESDSVVGANTFTFQINTNTINNSTTQALCQGSPGPCVGWQQFGLAISPGGFVGLFIQYWLLHYNAVCPSGWTQSLHNCFKNSPVLVVPRFSAAYSMANVTLGGGVGFSDIAYITFPDSTSPSGFEFETVSQDSVFNALGSWNQAEFNVFGFNNGSQANFNSGTTVIARINTYSGTGGAANVTPAPATCVQPGTTSGLTGETNNLNLLSPCCGDGAGISFVESNAASPPRFVCGGGIGM